MNGSYGFPYGKGSLKNPCLFSKYLYIKSVVFKLRLIWANPKDKRPICKSMFVCQRSNLELPSCLCKIVWVWGLFFLHRNWYYSRSGKEIPILTATRFKLKQCQTDTV